VLLPALSGHQLVVLWTELASLLLLARLLGALARRFRQPAVVGELVAGLVLGPSVLGQVSPTARQWFLPAGPGQGDLLTTVSQLSLLVLLVVVGAEADLPLIRSLGPAAASVSATTLLLPLGAGVAAATLLPAGFRAGREHVAFVLLAAGAVGVSSLPVVGKIMADLGLLRRNFAQLSLAAGTANDMVGFLLVTAATGLSGAGTPARLALALGGLMAAVVAVFTVGQWGVDAVLRRVRARGPNVAGSLTVAMVTAFAAAAACQAVGLEGALGGFLAGVALGRSRFQQGEAMAQLTRFTDAVLAPLFFATAGLRVDLTTLGRPSVLVATVLLVIGAVVAKGVSGIVGARLAGLAWRDGVALGVVLNGRGTLQVIIAGAALTAGVFTSAAYSAVIVLAIVSSLSVAPMLSLVLRGWQGTEQEQDRLEEEQRLAANVLVRDERLLVATGGSPSSYVAAAVLHHAWPERQPVTILAVCERSDAVDGPGRGATWMFPGRPVELITVGGEAVLRDVLAETRLGYGVLALGAADVPGPGS
jgi:Kef-type K+ transport system membrane component KefB